MINAYAGQVVNNYINNLQKLLGEYHYRGPVLVMQGYGGLLPAEQAAGRAVQMVECGPVAGVIGSKFLGDGMGDENIIAADMGGTTFKVGIIQNGAKPATAVESQVSCKHCGRTLAGADGNWKDTASLQETPMQSLGGPYSSGGEVLLRSFCCPGCSVLLKTETAMQGDPYLHDQIFIRR